MRDLFKTYIYYESTNAKQQKLFKSQFKSHIHRYIPNTVANWYALDLPKSHFEEKFFDNYIANFIKWVFSNLKKVMQLENPYYILNVDIYGQVLIKNVNKLQKKPHNFIVWKFVLCTHYNISYNIYSEHK